MILKQLVDSVFMIKFNFLDGITMIWFQVFNISFKIFFIVS